MGCTGSKEDTPTPTQVRTKVVQMIVVEGAAGPNERTASETLTRGKLTLSESDSRRKRSRVVLLFVVVLYSFIHSLSLTLLHSLSVL